MKKINLKGKTILVTGAAGFIGYFLSERLLNEFDNIKVIGLDNMNDYYDVKLKEWRLNNLNKYNNFTFIKGNLADKNLIDKVFNEYKPSIVVNLAAQAGVRYSIEHPDCYIESNLIGFYNIKIEYEKTGLSEAGRVNRQSIPPQTTAGTDFEITLYIESK